MVEEIRDIYPIEISQKLNDLILKNIPNHKIIYTDGSKSNIKTGLAIVAEDEVYSLYIHYYIHYRSNSNNLSFIVY